LPAVSTKDREDILFAHSKGVDIIASVVRTPWNVQQIRDVLREKGQNVRIIAKIESTEGVSNFDLILNAADAILVSRGDLGVELPMEQVFKAQKMIISKCAAAGKPVITSTQMLDSMTKNPRPTRAEATDVANAVLDGTDSVMLSGETAYGDYPFEALSYMSNMCKEAEVVESVSHYPSLFEALKAETKEVSIPEVVCSYAVRASNDLSAPLILVVTETGNTARKISKYRPNVPVLCVTTEPTSSYLALTRGTFPYVSKTTTFAAAAKLQVEAMEYAKKIGLVKSGDLVVVVQGVVHGMAGNTNSCQILVAP